jgi:ComF family protein
MAKLSIRDFFLELIFPEFCLNCQKLGPSLCANCYHGLNFYFQGQKPNIVEENKEQVYFDQLQIMAQFRGPLQKLIKALKYQNAKNIAPLLAKMLHRHLKIPSADMLTFIPLHPKKLRWRGYNQCQEIALTLGEISKIPVQNLLIKTINNQAQAQIKEQKTRQERMRGVFAIPTQNLPIIKNKHIMILDDVLTTGATVNEASRLLKLFGARKVDVIVLASKMD